jgi:G3E family GTPase
MQFRGPDLLRVKGIINVEGMDRPMTIHGVQHVFHPPEVLERWPSEDRRTKVGFYR